MLKEVNLWEKVTADPLSLRLMELLCGGIGVEVNYTELASKVNCHRTTAKNRVEQLFKHKIVDQPVYHFRGLLRSRPFMVLEQDYFPMGEKTEDFVRNDPMIWASYFVKDGEHNTLLIELHKDLYAYQEWRANHVDPLHQHIRMHPSSPVFVSTRNIKKYEPACSLKVIKEEFEEGKLTKLNGLPLDSLTLDILEHVLRGEGFKTNETFLAEKLGKHRLTIARRLVELTAELPGKDLFSMQVLAGPFCRFPNVWTPPEYFLVLSFVELRDPHSDVFQALQSDNHVPILIRAFHGRYNYIVFSNFSSVSEHLRWQKNYDDRFGDALGAIRNIYLSPEMTFSIAHEQIGLQHIRLLHSNV